MSLLDAEFGVRAIMVKYNYPQKLIEKIIERGKIKHELWLKNVFVNLGDKGKYGKEKI